MDANWGLAVLGAGIALGTLLIAMFTLRRAADRDFMAQQTAHIADLKEELTQKSRRIDYLEERVRELSDTMSRRDSEMLSRLLQDATIHKQPTKTNGEGNGGTT